MARNLHERCEVVFPIEDGVSAKRLRSQILDSYLKDNTKARLLQPDGSYVRAPLKGEPFSAQEYFMELAGDSVEQSLPSAPATAAESDREAQAS